MKAVDPIESWTNKEDLRQIRMDIRQAKIEEKAKDYRHSPTDYLMGLHEATISPNTDWPRFHRLVMEGKKAEALDLLDTFVTKELDAFAEEYYE
jgi:hypothetical protein